MAKQCFKRIRLSDEKLAIIAQANEIIEEYQAQDLRMTLRQLYYQFVSRDLIPNTPRSYARLGDIISDGRIGGYVDWDAIEDRGRQVDAPGEWESIGHIAKVAMNSFRLPRWKDQPNYVELWVEKQALAGVLEPLARKHHVPLMVNKGYSSSSAMYASAKRISAACTEKGTQAMVDAGKIAEANIGKRIVIRPAVILYLGDHDPSGEDMVRDIRDRLALFLPWAPELVESHLEVIKIGLTMAQIRQYKPPPNPAKITDSRAKKYIEQHGTESWEVDALPPNVLARLVDRHIEQRIDQKLLTKVLGEELTQKQKLTIALGEAGFSLADNEDDDEESES